jgi:hypothetical protein
MEMLQKCATLKLRATYAALVIPEFFKEKYLEAPPTFSLPGGRFQISNKSPVRADLKASPRPALAPKVPGAETGVLRTILE